MIIRIFRLIALCLVALVAPTKGQFSGSLWKNKDQVDDVAKEGHPWQGDTSQGPVVEPLPATSNHRMGAIQETKNGAEPSTSSPSKSPPSTTLRVNALQDNNRNFPESSSNERPSRVLIFGSLLDFIMSILNLFDIFNLIPDPPTPAPPITPPGPITGFVDAGCFKTESSLDSHVLPVSDLIAQQCSTACSLSTFFGIVPGARVNCLCFRDSPQQRLSIGSCSVLNDVPADELMTLYFRTSKSEDCGLDQTATVRNFLVEEDDTPFGFDIVTGTFKASPFELFYDKCGTNMYKVQTETSETSTKLTTTSQDMSSYATSVRTNMGASLKVSTGAKFPIKMVKIGVETSLGGSLEVSTALESSAANVTGSRIFTSFGVKRLAEVKIADFENQKSFVTLNAPFGNLLRDYLQGSFSKDTANEIIEKYGTFVMTRGVFGGYQEQRASVSTRDLTTSFSSSVNFEACFELSVAAEATILGYGPTASTEAAGCFGTGLDVMTASRNKFSEEYQEQTVVGGKIVDGEFRVEAQDATLLKTRDKYEVGDDGPVFQLLSDFLASDKISPIEVKRLQITEEQFDEIRVNLETHIFEYLTSFEDKIKNCGCSEIGLPYLTGDKLVCRCYEPEPLKNNCAGVYDPLTGACCSAQCGLCFDENIATGGFHAVPRTCGELPGGSSQCCPPVIVANEAPCSAANLPPCKAEPALCQGLLGPVDGVCCSLSCPFCGGPGCIGDCCSSVIKSKNEKCTDIKGPPCVAEPVERTCNDGGILSLFGGSNTKIDAICCPKECGACGGTDCHTRPGGSRNCCHGRIAETQSDCWRKGPPCVYFRPGFYPQT